MGLFDRFRGKSGKAESRQQTASQASEQQQQPRDPVRVVDEKGNAFLIEKEVYAKLVPQHLEKVWEEPRALQAVIGAFIGDGLFKEVLPGARRLVEIADDAAAEDARMLLAHVLNQLGESDEARSIVEAVIDEQGESAHRLANLARVSYAQDRKDEFRAQVKRALQLEPNRLDALQMWMADLQQHRGGEGVEAQLVEFARRTNSWLAWIMLASSLAEQGNVVDAEQHLRDHVDFALVDSVGLGLSSAVLCQAGQFATVVELLGPHYDIAKHGHEAGFNLAQAHVAIGEREQALSLLDQIEQLDRPDLAQFLAQVREQATRTA